MKTIQLLEESLRKLITEAQVLQRTSSFEAAQKMYENWILDHEPRISNQETDSNRILAEAYNNLGQLKYLQVEFVAAVKEYDRAIKLNPTFASAFYNRGTIKYRMGKFHEAAQDFRQAVSLEPTNLEFQLGLERTQEELK